MISDTERAAGRRADFRVYYRRNGKAYFDVMWGLSKDEVAEKMRAFAKELRWKIEVERVELIGSSDA